MNQHISAHSLRQLLHLTEKKERLANEIEKIEDQISALLSGGKVRGKKGRSGRSVKGTKRTTKVRRGRRGSLGKKILVALENAGPAGVKVAALAKKIGVKGTNLHVWFATTGKKHAKKIGRGHYRLKK